MLDKLIGKTVSCYFRGAVNIFTSIENFGVYDDDKILGFGDKNIHQVDNYPVQILKRNIDNIETIDNEEDYIHIIVKLGSDTIELIYE